MKCIFCGVDSSDSKSVEHIIPESFGNTTAILRKCVVCDKCNNYFSRKVEGPFLNTEAIQLLRQELEIKKKNGNVITRFAYPQVGKEYVHQISEDRYIIYTTEEKTEKELASSVAQYQNYMSVSDGVLLKEDYHTSRLLAKMAVEFFVYENGSTDEICEYVLSDEVFQNIRKYARFGDNKTWAYNARRIYSRNEAYEDDIFKSISWEATFLFLGNGEVYFIVAMYGIEYALNLGGSYIDGYKFWLKQNNEISPLYITHEDWEKNFNEYRAKIAGVQSKSVIYEFGPEINENKKNN